MGNHQHLEAEEEEGQQQHQEKSKCEVGGTVDRARAITHIHTHSFIQFIR